MQKYSIQKTLDLAIGISPDSGMILTKIIDLTIDKI
jgi:hypothetical protein